MGYRLKQTRGGYMLFPTPSAAQRRKARQQAKSVRRAMAKRCKCWHGESAQEYAEQLAMRMTGPVNPGRNSCQPASKAGVSDNAISSRQGQMVRFPLA